MKYACFFGKALNDGLPSETCKGDLIYFTLTMNNNLKPSVFCKFHFDVFQNKFNQSINFKKITEEQYEKYILIS